MLDDAAIDRLIQAYDSHFAPADRTEHAALADALLGGRANRVTAARLDLEAALSGADATSQAVALLAGCDQLADMARAALEYQIRINEVILGYPRDGSSSSSSSSLFGGFRSDGQDSPA